MTAQDYIDIATICRAGSFRQAAIELGISQPTLSHRVERIEKALGVQLFERARGRSRPNDAARFIAERADTLIAEAGSLSRDVRRFLKGQAGKVTLGFGPVPAHAFLPEILKAVAKALPELAVDVFLGSPVQLSEWLHQGQVDFAVCSHDEQLFPDPLVRRRLRDDPIVIAGAPSHPLIQAGGPEKLADLFRHPLAFPTLDIRYLNAFQKLYGVDYLHLDGAIQCSDYGVLVRMAESGEFLTAGPGFTFHREIEAGTLASVAWDDRLVH